MAITTRLSLFTVMIMYIAQLKFMLMVQQEVNLQLTNVILVQISLLLKKILEMVK